MENQQTGANHFNITQMNNKFKKPTIVLGIYNWKDPSVTITVEDGVVRRSCSGEPTKKQIAARDEFLKRYISMISHTV